MPTTRSGENPESILNTADSRKTRWLTRNVFAIGMLSLFSDMGHELTTALLPVFLASFGASTAALGVIEGVSDAASSLLKLWMSMYSDRVGRRKPILAIGYLVTAMMGTFAFVTAWWQMLVIRTVAWIGRGARGPVRDALLSESVPPAAHGRAFGFEGAMDTLGAIIGPVIALSLLGVLPIRHIFAIAFLPGAVTVLIVLFWLREVPRKPQPGLRMWSSLRSLPRPFLVYVAAVGVFGLGNFAPTLLVMRVAMLLTPVYGQVSAGRIAIALFILHNVLYAAVSYPAGAMGDRMDKKKLLATGYGLFGIMCLGFLSGSTSLVLLSALFALAGIYIGIVDAMERALAADLLPLAQRGIGYGALATANSAGDLLSSVIVGFLWSRVSFQAGFLFGAVFTLAGAVALFAIPRPGPAAEVEGRR
jgi:MFS family permease